MIFIIDDDEIMAECIARNCEWEIRIFSNTYEALDEISDGNLPNLIFLDVLLDGVDGFTLLNELVSYDDTALIPIIIVSSLDLGDKNLKDYGVVGVLDKSKMMPRDVKEYARRYGK